MNKTLSPAMTQQVMNNSGDLIQNQELFQSMLMGSMNMSNNLPTMMGQRTGGIPPGMQYPLLQSYGIAGNAPQNVLRPQMGRGVDVQPLVNDKTRMEPVRKDHHQAQSQVIVFSIHCGCDRLS
jgi:hypothetical protein